jgi:hypothetical protein
MLPGAAYAATWGFADALIWNWLIAGTDAHAKNYSVLLAGNDIRLAPLYDMSSALQASLAPDAFADAANAPDAFEPRRLLSSRLVELVADRAERCLRILK